MSCHLIIIFIMQIFGRVVGNTIQKMVETQNTDHLHSYFQNSFLVMDWLHTVRLCSGTLCGTIVSSATCHIKTQSPTSNFKLER